MSWRFSVWTGQIVPAPTSAPTPRMSKYQVRAFFLCAFSASWGIGLAGLIAPRIFPGAPAFAGGTPFHALAAYAVSLTGIIMTAVYDGGAGLRHLGERLLPWRTGPAWYLIVLGGYGLITFAGWRCHAFTVEGLRRCPACAHC